MNKEPPNPLFMLVNDIRRCFSTYPGAAVEFGPHPTLGAYARVACFPTNFPIEPPINDE